MNLQHLCSAPQVEVYFDKRNNWLFIDWVGDLTLPIMHNAMLEIARCYLDNAYPRLLNSNAHVTSIAPEVPVWLTERLLPTLALAGIQQAAWVISPTLPGASSILATYAEQAHPVVSFFSDIEEAVDWLQGTRPALTSGSCQLPRPLQQNTSLREAVEGLAQELHKTATKRVAAYPA